MPREENALDTEVVPGGGKVRKIHPPFFFLAVGMPFEDEAIDVVAFSQIAFKVLAFVFIGDLTFDLKKGREKR